MLQQYGVSKYYDPKLCITLSSFLPSSPLPSPLFSSLLFSSLLSPPQGTDLTLGDWSTEHRTLSLDNVSITFGVDDMRFTAATIIALDYSRLVNISLSELTNQRVPGTISLNGVDCILDAAAALNVSDFTVEMTKLRVPTIHGLLDGPLDSLVNTALSATYDFVEHALITHLKGMFYNSIR